MAFSARTKEMQIDDFEIIEILANSKLFCDNWKLFCKVLKFKNADVYHLERLFNSGAASIVEIISEILKNWKSIDPDDANIKCLPAKLREIGCIKCAEEIEGISRNNEDSIGNIWFNIREPTTYYLGRENEMKVIEKQFQLCLDKKTMMVVAITGLGGIGKTEIARNYAKQFYEAVKGHCIWIDSETDQSMKQSLQDLARIKLNLALKDDSGREKSLEILLEEIYRKISSKTPLIIFDNLESYENSILHSLFDLASKEPPEILKPFVITTSRFGPAKKYFGDKCIHLELDVLEEKSAVEFFTKSFNANVHLQEKCYLEAVGQLCGRLPFYPLAMQQAAAYINGNLSNSPKASTLAKEIGKYLEKLENETWRITFEKINEAPGNGSEAIQLMNIISFVSPDNIAKDFLINMLQKIEENGSSKTESKDEYTNRIENSLELLRNHSMIKISEDKISIRPLVQEITRINLEESGKFNSTLDKLVQCMEKMLENDEVSLDQLIHIQMVWQFAVKNPEIIVKYPDFAEEIFYKLYSSGRYQDSLDFSCMAVKELESIFGEEDGTTLRMGYWKGAALRELGMYEDSLSLLLEVYRKQKELFGDEYDDTLNTARQIGVVYDRLNYHEEAVKWYADALKKIEDVSGKEHTETPSLATAPTGQIKYKYEMELYKVLEVEERLLGKNHPNTLSTKHNMAIILFKEKQFEEALKMFQEILDVEEKVLELNHPETLTTKYMIASTYKSLGRVEEALQLAEEVYEKRMEILGPQHPDTINSLTLLEELKTLKEEDHFNDTTTIKLKGQISNHQMQHLKSVSSLQMENISVAGENGEKLEEINIAEILKQSHLHELQIISSNPNATKIHICFNDLPSSIAFLSLANCKISFTQLQNLEITDTGDILNNFKYLSRLVLQDLHFLNDRGEQLGSFDITTLVKNAKIQSLKMVGSNMRIDFGEVRKIFDAELQGVQIYFPSKDREVLAQTPTKKTNSLFLNKVSFADNNSKNMRQVNFFELCNIKVRKLSIVGAFMNQIRFDFTKLSQEIEELTLQSVVIEYPCPETQIPKFQQLASIKFVRPARLTLQGKDDKDDSSVLSKFFASCISLEYLSFIEPEKLKIDLSKIPPTLKYLELKGSNAKNILICKIPGRQIPFTLKSLIMDSVPFEDYKSDILRKLLSRTSKIIVKHMNDVRRMKSESEIQKFLEIMCSFVDLQSFAIGKFNWEAHLDDKMWNCLFQHNEHICQSDCYLFEKNESEGSWLAIEINLGEFEKLNSFDHNVSQRKPAEDFGDSISESEIMRAEGGDPVFHDFTVDFMHVTHIRQLLEDVITLEEWTLLLNELVPRGSLPDIMNMGSFALKLRKGLETWITKNTKEKRAFSTFIAFFDQQNLPKAAESLRQHCKTISTMDTKG